MTTTHSVIQRVRRRAAAVSVGLLLGTASVAGATRCPTIAGGAPSLGELDVEQRMEFIRSSLAVSARHSRIWKWTWVGVYGTLSVTTLALTPVRDPDDRRVGYVSASSAALGVVTGLVLPPRVIADQRRLEARLRTAPLDLDRCSLLAEAESTLMLDAANEARGKGALIHVVSFAYAVAVGMFYGFYWGEWTHAQIFMLTGIAISEIQIFTQPADSMEALRRYRNGSLDPLRGVQMRVPLSVAPSFGDGRWGVQVAGTF